MNEEIKKILCSRTDNMYLEQMPQMIDKLYTLIQIIFDPENQPNQLGIENTFVTFKSE